MPRKIKITITDEQGVLLDATTLTIPDNISAFAFRGLSVGETSRPDEHEPLVIGAP